MTIHELWISIIFFEFQIVIKIETKIKTKKIDHVLEFDASQWLKLYIESNSKKGIEAEKNNDKEGKGLYEIMNIALYGKTMQNLRNRIDAQRIPP